MVNFTCPVKHLPEPDPVPFLTNGNVNFKAHDVGWLVCGFLSLIATVTSLWLVLKHLKYYTCPQQQRHIVRMLFMVPIYSLVSFASYLFYEEALYYQVVRDCYEAVTITSFFLLLLQYVGDTPEEQNVVFRKVQLKSWFFPLGSWKYRPDGLKFLWLMKICILQYAVLRPLCTLATVGMQYFGLYCVESWMPWFGHIWVALTITVSVSVAMYCVVQFYLPIAEELKPYAPVLKFLAVKAVVFLTFWQESFLSVLVLMGTIKDAAHWNAEEIVVGLSAILSCFEMVIFAFMHIKAFSYLPYQPADQTRTTKRLRAFGHVLDFRDWFVLMKQSSKWAAANRKGLDYTPVDAIRAQKYDHLMKALGKERHADLQDFRDHQREELMAHFWKKPHHTWDEKDGTHEGSDDDKEKEKPINAVRPDGGLYTVAELQQRAKQLAAGGHTEEDRSYHGSRAGSDAPAKSAKPKMEELRRLTSVLDQHEDDDEDEYAMEGADGKSLLPSPYGNDAGRTARIPQLQYEQHPELSAYHIGYPPLGLDLDTPDADGGKCFAEEMEDEYKARGLWPVLEGGRGQYSMTGQNDDSAPIMSGIKHGKQQSWWRALRTRISGSGVDERDRSEVDSGARWREDRAETQGGFEEPAWLSTGVYPPRPPLDNGTLPGPRRSSLAIGAEGLTSTGQDATPIERSFMRVSGQKLDPPPNGPTIPPRRNTQVSRKAVPPPSDSSHASPRPGPLRVDTNAIHSQPWLLQQEQSPLSQIVTSQIQYRESSLKPEQQSNSSSAARLQHDYSEQRANAADKKSGPKFHPARPISTIRAVESGPSTDLELHSASSLVEGPHRNKSLSASVQLASEPDTFGVKDRDSTSGRGGMASSPRQPPHASAGASSPRQPPHASAGNGGGGGGGTGLAVGNVVSRAEIADAQWGPQLQAEPRPPRNVHHHSYRHQNQDHNGGYAGNVRQQQSSAARPSSQMRQSMPHQHRTHSSSSAAPGTMMSPGSVPLNAIGAIPPSSSHRHYQYPNQSQHHNYNQQHTPQPSSASRTRRHSDQYQRQHYQGQQPSSSGGPRGSYNPYTGEPMRMDGYGRSVSRDWAAAHGSGYAATPAPLRAAPTATVRSTSPPPGSELDLEGGFGRVIYID
ncbi:unnamed protein product [Tilletia laevis]|uniref:DUF300-domain-containing protein n=2 Tax=Tilletia TaxID=13289 RepID=A0A177V4X7_9BASI|nr:hypothetical protein CF336_g4071 [Tilletia laevis]KAE8261321.1 hypothetical protein A4X03_0g3356 [Tilletia caries]CAD6985723.1 unnamed protein product [Tilletia controversa]KAE8202897.1 hypothetical protein CF335_g3239 [Tilletia laevis]CAD6884608.1 unnamed protein product [Tilletia caries]